MLMEGGTSREEEKALTMHDQDAGSLFGIRAIEAGYYGGVAQSRGNSMASSLVGTPSPSVTDFSKSAISFNSKLSTSSTANLPDPRSTTFSTSSSILRLSKFGVGEMHNQTGHSTNGSNLKNSSQPLDLDTSKRNSTSLTKLTNVKLRPSYAEENKRHNHSPVDMDLTVPPSPVSQSFVPALRNSPSPPSLESVPSLRNSPSPPSPSLSPTPPTPPLDASYTTNIFRQPMISDLDSPNGQVISLPEHIGKMSQNPHSSARSVRGSVISWAASSHRRSMSPPPSLPPIPSPAIRLPAFPKKAVVDSSSPKFSGFVKERSRAPDSTPPQSSGQGYPVLTGLYSPKEEAGFMLTILQVPKKRSSTTTPPLPPPKSPRHQTHSFINFADMDDLNINISPRTSFSFSMTNPDYNGNDDDSSTPRKLRIGDIPMSSLRLPKPGTKEFEPLTVDFYAPPKPISPPGRTWHP
jgi:hypothetical protein